MIHQDLPPCVLENGFPVVRCSGVRISSRMKSSLYYHITSRKFLDYLTSNGKLAEGVEKHIHWKALKFAKNESSYFINNMIAKWTCNQLPTALVQHRWGKAASSRCPRCQQTVETSNHVLRCPNTQTIWNEGIALLQSWLSTNHTEPELHDMLLTGIELWRTGHRNSVISFSNPRITLLSTNRSILDGLCCSWDLSPSI